jgi:hypothetical protein
MHFMLARVRGKPQYAERRVPVRPGRHSVTLDEKAACRISDDRAPFDAVTRWIALAVVAVVGATLLLTWPDVREESGPERAASLYGYDAKNCKAPCAYGPSWVAYRVNKLFASHIQPGAWSGKPLEQEPAVGAVAWFGDDQVAFVERVLSPDAVEITELSSRALTRRTVTRGQGWPRAFILLGPRPTDKPPTPASTGDGTLI